MPRTRAFRVILHQEVGSWNSCDRACAWLVYERVNAVITLFVLTMFVLHDVINIIEDDTLSDDERQRHLSDAIKAGADVNLPRDDEVPLHVAVDRRQKKTVEKLLTAGARVNTLDHNFWSALNIALDLREKHIAQLLVDHGAEFAFGVSSNKDGERIVQSYRRGDACFEAVFPQLVEKQKSHISKKKIQMQNSK